MGNAAPTLGPLSQPPSPVPVVKPDAIMAEYEKGIGLSAALSGSQKLDLQASITFRTMAKVQGEIDKIQQQINNLGTANIDIASREGYAKLLDPLTKLYADLNSSYTRILEGSAKLKKDESKSNPEDIALKQSSLRAQTAASNASAANSAAQAAEATARQKQIEFATAIAEATSPATIEAARAAAETATINLEKAKIELASIVLVNEHAKAKNIVIDQVTSGEIDWNEARKKIALIDGKFDEYAQTEIQRAQLTLAQKQSELSEAGVTGVYQGLPTVASRQLSLAEQEAAANQNYRDAQLTIQQAAEARAAAQARAQNMQALTSAQTQRQAAYNQAATEYERFGVATPNRIQGLQDLKAPLPAAQAAGMLGLDVNSPEFKAVYDTYSMALAPGQGAQQPTQPAPVTPAPAPVSNPVTNSTPAISMPTMGNTPYLTQALGGLKTGYSPA